MRQPRNRTCFSYYTLIVTLSAILLLFISASAADMVCDHCGEKITKSGWVEFDGKYYHADHFICANCGGDLKAGLVYIESGQKYDSTCYFELFVPNCALCGQPIQGNYIEDDSNLYHQQCYEDHVGPRCAICGETIYGEYLTDIHGNTFHASHKDEYPVCEYCGRAIAPNTTGGGETYSDDRHVCAICLKSAVNDIKEAKDLMAQIIEELADKGIEIEEKRIPLQLVDRPKLRRKAGSSVDDPAGYTSYRKQTALAGIWSRKDFEIFVLYGMPKAGFILTLGHELMHVWLFKNGESDMADILTEGSCQYAGMLAIGDLEGEDADMLRQTTMESPDPIYGEGLRLVDAYVSEVGIPAWLEYLKSHKNPPW